MEKRRFFTPEETYSYKKDMESLKHEGVLQEAFQYGEAERAKEQGKYTLEDYYGLPEDVLILCDRDKLTRKCIVGAPDFILEVLSPSTGYKDSTLKLQKYAAAGVKEYWLLDPDKEKLLVYDFTREQNPTIYGMTGKVPVGIYGGKLQIDLDLVREYGLDIFD